MANLILDCGCEIIVIGKGGKMSTPCTTHFGRHRVGIVTEDTSDTNEMRYRIGFEFADSNDGAFRYFPTLEGAEKYWNEKNLSSVPDMVMQRKSRTRQGFGWIEL